MLREDQIEVIKKYVPEKYFDQKKLIRYLTLHEMVGVEVFMYVAKEPYDDALKGYETVLPVMFKESWAAHEEDEDVYCRQNHFEPEDVDTFVRRIPFNFYHKGDDIRVDENGKETHVWRPIEITAITYAVGQPMDSLYYHREEELTLKDAYTKLE